MKKVSQKWFEGDALDIARNMLGKVIEYDGCSGMIVESEAYKSDPASHAYKITPRSEIMLATYGKIYVYLIYGMYFCLNITTNKNATGAVLIRAIEPLSGIKKMESRRKTKNILNLTSGPGKLCQALNISKGLNNTKINDSIKIFNYKEFKDNQITSSKRIGISNGKDLDWRFFVKDNQFVSKNHQKL